METKITHFPCRGGGDEKTDFGWLGFFGYFRLVKIRIGFIGLGAMTFLKITVAIIKLVYVKH
jgi:hypothetical protein